MSAQPKQAAGEVLGGVFLGVAWSAFVLWLPERRLPSPVARCFWGGLRKPAAGQ